MCACSKELYREGLQGDEGGHPTQKDDSGVSKCD